MSAANPPRAEPACEQVHKESALRKFVYRLALIPNNGLRIFIRRVAYASIVHRKGSINKLSRRPGSSKGPMGDKFFVLGAVLHLVCHARWNVHGFPRIQPIGPAFNQDARRTQKHRNSLAECVRMIGQKCTGLEFRDSGAEVRGPAGFRNKNIKINARDPQWHRFARSRAENRFLGWERALDQTFLPAIHIGPSGHQSAV